MKKACLAISMVIWLGFWFLFSLSGSAQADSPIYQGLFWDAAPAVAYNSQRGEFLVVWNTYNPLYPPNDVHFFGQVMGQLIKENGNKIGDPFEIIASGGVLPKVAYNAQKNEYLVVAESNYRIVGQRVGALGMKVGGLNTYLNHTNPNDVKYRVPRVMYNSLAGAYLVAGASWNDTPSCALQIYTLPVGASGQPLGTATKVADEGYSYCSDGAIYALEYAPIVSAKAPQGRYLLAIVGPTNLRMLNSQGQVLPVLYDPDHGTWYDNVPFQSLVGTSQYNIDIAYGTWVGQPTFFLLWGDPSRKASGNSHQVGIWGGIVQADKELYYTTDPVSNEIFPLGWQWSHLTDADHYKSWKPVVKYNNTAATFVVAWRETPGTAPYDLTSVNHIRVNTSSSYSIPPQTNLVVSATTGTENPMAPAFASSSKTAALLIAWEDYRNILGDIYGTMFDAGTRSASGINPGGNLPVYWKSVSAGWFHSLGIRSDGSLWAWGTNDKGQLGIGNTEDQHNPVPVAKGSTWLQVSNGIDYSLGIKMDGSLWAWGRNDYGQLGIGNLPDQHIPVPVAEGSNWFQASAGHYHIQGIKADGSLWAWGRNNYGQLGTKYPDDQYSPVPVDPGTTWGQISAGGQHSVGIKTDGSLWAWGSNYQGALGIGIPPGEMDKPAPVLNVGNIVLVSARSYYTLGLQYSQERYLWSWGDNDNGQLGIGEPLVNFKSVPAPVFSGLPWAQVSAGFSHSLGIKTDGSLWAWGNNERGELGTGDDNARQYSPIQVGKEMDWVSVSAGNFFSLGLRSDGCLYAWGLNDHGQLGLGDIQERHVPTLIPFSCPSLNPPPVPIGLRLWLPLILKQ